MIVLVANLGSTSFKFRLFDMADERQLARGEVERIGADRSEGVIETDGGRTALKLSAADHGAAVTACLDALIKQELPCLGSIDDIGAIGFKAVHGGRVSGVRRVDEEVLQAMTEVSDVCPAHNPPYVAAMRQLGSRLPKIPLVAAFETGFHDTIPERLRTYAVPYQWSEEFHLRRWGFHGASHRYVAERIGERVKREDLRLITCHLGGSSSVCASRGGRSVATSMGMSPQTGLPQNNRVGDFDAYALPMLARRMDATIEDVLRLMACEGGLLGVSGVSGDVRDLYAASERGDRWAQLALDVYVSSVRHYLGAYLVELGGLDAIAFTAGIGEHQPRIRTAVCGNLQGFGVVLDEGRNRATSGETPIHADDSQVQIWVVPTNEELIVARQTRELLENSN